MNIKRNLKTKLKIMIKIFILKLKIVKIYNIIKFKIWLINIFL